MNKPEIVTYEEAVKLLKEGKMWAYMKPTRYLHDSGFRTFEIGHCEVDPQGNVIRKHVVGSCTDHIWLSSFRTSAVPTDKLGYLNWNIGLFDLNMDLTKDGYIRLFSSLGKICWGVFGTIADRSISSMSLMRVPQDLPKDPNRNE